MIGGVKLLIIYLLLTEKKSIKCVW